MKRREIKPSSPLPPDRAKQLSSSLRSTVAMTPPGSCSSMGPIRSCVIGGGGGPWTWPKRACTTRFWSCCWRTGCTSAPSPWTRPARCCGMTAPTCTPLGPPLPVCPAGAPRSQDPSRPGECHHLHQGNMMKPPSVLVLGLTLCTFTHRQLSPGLQVQGLIELS